jgi:hypothetical protein
MGGTIDASKEPSEIMQLANLGKKVASDMAKRRASVGSIFSKRPSQVNYSVAKESNGSVEEPMIIHSSSNPQMKDIGARRHSKGSVRSASDF